MWCRLLVASSKFHRNTYAALISYFLRASVAGINVADNAHARVIGEHRAKEVADERGVRIPMEFKARD